MDEDFWRSRWDQGQIGFHQEAVNPYLERYWARAAAPSGSRVFVPLCGKSKDMVWLAERGHSVVGVEIVRLAVEAFFTEQQLEPRRRSTGVFEVWEAGPYTLFCGDFFDITPVDVGGAGAVYDRASLIALPPELRQRYARHLLSLIAPGKNVLLVTMDYDQQEMSGPPFSVAEAEVRALYAGDCDVELLDSADVLADNPRFQERGLTRLDEKTYLLRRR